MCIHKQFLILFIFTHFPSITASFSAHVCLSFLQLLSWVECCVCYTEGGDWLNSRTERQSPRSCFCWQRQLPKGIKLLLFQETCTSESQPLAWPVFYLEFNPWPPVSRTQCITVVNSSNNRPSQKCTSFGMAALCHFSRNPSISSYSQFGEIQTMQAGSDPLPPLLNTQTIRGRQTSLLMLLTSRHRRAMSSVSLSRPHLSMSHMRVCKPILRNDCQNAARAVYHGMPKDAQVVGRLTARMGGWNGGCCSAHAQSYKEQL